jgi:hypothetical protein
VWSRVVDARAGERERDDHAINRLPLTKPPPLFLDHLSHQHVPRNTKKAILYFVATLYALLCTQRPTPRTTIVIPSHEPRWIYTNEWYHKVLAASSRVHLNKYVINRQYVRIPRCRRQNLRGDPMLSPKRMPASVVKIKVSELVIGTAKDRSALPRVW